MKQIAINILFLLTLVSCSNRSEPTSIEVETDTSQITDTAHFQDENTYCAEIQFPNIQAQADSLLEFMNNATTAEQSMKPYWEEKFFCAFPNSFGEMERMFGYHDSIGEAPLYSSTNPTKEYLDKHIFSDVIGFFSELSSIPKDEYYKKYIEINIDGYWQADNINEAFGFYYVLLQDPENVVKVLSRYSDTEIRSVFRFIFDGPHPKNEYNEAIYNRLKLNMENHSDRLVKLLEKSYTSLISEDDGHGH